MYKKRIESKERKNRIFMEENDKKYEDYLSKIAQRGRGEVIAGSSPLKPYQLDDSVNGETGKSSKAIKGFHS
jgi:hypothetical protein